MEVELDLMNEVDDELDRADDDVGLATDEELIMELVEGVRTVGTLTKRGDADEFVDTIDELGKFGVVAFVAIEGSIEGGTEGSMEGPIEDEDAEELPEGSVEGLTEGVLTVMVWIGTTIVR